MGSGSEGVHVLFLNHAATQIGPPVGLLALQRWLRANTDLRFATVSTVGGSLLPRFEQLGPTTLIRSHWSPELIVKGVLERAGRDAEARRVTVGMARQKLRLALRSGPPDLIYVNALAPANVLALRALRTLYPSTPVVSHVHELSVVLEHDLAPGELAFALESSDHLVVPADAVRSYLHDRHGVADDRMTTIPEAIDPPRPRAELDAGATAVRHELGLAADDPLVVACGSVDWRKAPDLFLRLAWEQGRRRPDLPVTYAWLGDTAANGYQQHLVEFELDRLRLRDRVRFVGLRDDPSSWFAAADVFVLPSREDPFPLVCLEAAAVGTPIVCFDTGGIVELVEPAEAGIVVPYPDVRAMTDAVCGLLDDPAAREAAGENGARTVHASYLTDHLAPKVLEAIETHRTH
jgi:glycosyltransferase involved in cell wall biosynthesis